MKSVYDRKIVQFRASLSKPGDGLPDAQFIDTGDWWEMSLRLTSSLQLCEKGFTVFLSHYDKPLRPIKRKFRRKSPQPFS